MSPTKDQAPSLTAHTCPEESRLLHRSFEHGAWSLGRRSPELTASSPSPSVGRQRPDLQRPARQQKRIGVTKPRRAFVVRRAATAPPVHGHSTPKTVHIHHSRTSEVGAPSRCARHGSLGCRRCAARGREGAEVRRAPCTEACSDARSFSCFKSRRVASEYDSEVDQSRSAVAVTGTGPCPFARPAAHRHRQVWNRGPLANMLLSP